MPVWVFTGILWVMKKKVSLLLFALLWLTVSCDRGMPPVHNRIMPMGVSLRQTDKM